MLSKEGFMIGKGFLKFTIGHSKVTSRMAMVCLGGLLTAGVSSAEVSSQEFREMVQGTNAQLTAIDSTDGLPREAVLPLSLAKKAASAAVEQCTKDGYRVSVAVVDRAGVVRALLREDGAGPHTVDSSRKKAYTSASLKRPTAELGELIAKMPAVQALRDMNENMLLLGGGLPI